LLSWRTGVGLVSGMTHIPLSYVSYDVHPEPDFVSFQPFQ
jgi:hypothetical protein